MTRKPVRYVLVNPHDAYEFTAVDDAVADAVASLLGGGWFGWARGDAVGVVIGSLEPDEQDEFGAGVRETMERRPKDVAAALRSLEIEPDGRVVMRADPDEWHRTHRTALADVRENAFSTADALDPLSVE